MRTLLIVDDQKDLESLFRRFLRKYFDEICFECSAAGAEALLQAKVVTHLVADSRLPDTYSGSERVAAWRNKYPSIQHAYLFTGLSEFQNSSIPGVDRVFLKPEGFDGLLDVLSVVD